MENPQIISKLSSIALDELGLSVLSYNSLRRAGIITLFDLYTLIQEGSLSQVQNIGEISEKVILSKFDSFVEDLKNKQEKLLIDSHSEVESKELSVTLLVDELGEKTINQLHLMGIETFGELSDFISNISNLIQDNEKVIDLAIQDLVLKVKEKIKHTGLQTGIFIDGKRLYSILYDLPDNEKSKHEKYTRLKMVMDSHSLNDELDTIYHGLLTKDIYIFIFCTLRNYSYRELGKRFNLPEARVRQIHEQTLGVLTGKIKENPFPYLQSVFLIADDLGEDLTEKKLKSRLLKCGMISPHKQNRSQNLYNRLLALLIHPKITSIIEFKKQDLE